MRAQSFAGKYWTIVMGSDAQFVLSTSGAWLYAPLAYEERNILDVAVFRTAGDARRIMEQLRKPTAPEEIQHGTMFAHSIRLAGKHKAQHA